MQESKHTHTHTHTHTKMHLGIVAKPLVRGLPPDTSDDIIRCMDGLVEEE